MVKDYFALMSLPKKLVIDHNELKKQYHKLLKIYSTDPVLDKPAGNQDKQKLEQINTAYQTLKDRYLRIVHLLEVNGVSFKKDRAPTQFTDLEREAMALLEEVKAGKREKVDKLKKLHADILNEFSHVSMELAHLEKAWDASNDNETAQTLLRKLSRKSAAFHYIRTVEQDIRQVVGT